MTGVDTGVIRCGEISWTRIQIVLMPYRKSGTVGNIILSLSRLGVMVPSGGERVGVIYLCGGKSAESYVNVGHIASVITSCVKIPNTVFGFMPKGHS
jgi:hypothetical protein